MGNITTKEKIKRLESQLRFHTEMENKSMIENLTARIEKLKSKISINQKK